MMQKLCHGRIIQRDHYSKRILNDLLEQLGEKREDVERVPRKNHA
jgi:hypothetical protein